MFKQLIFFFFNDLLATLAEELSYLTEWLSQYQTSNFSEVEGAEREGDQKTEWTYHHHHHHHNVSMMLAHNYYYLEVLWSVIFIHTL